MVRRMLDLSSELEALQKFFESEGARANERESGPLSLEEQAAVDEYNACRDASAIHDLYLRLPLKVQLNLIRDGMKEIARDPYSHSKISEWLSLETWLPKDALLLLAGIDPSGAVVEWTYENFMGVQIDNPRISVANDLNSIHDDYIIPPPDAWDDDITALKKKIRKGQNLLPPDQLAELEGQLARLEGHVQDESVQRRARQLKLRSKILSTLSKAWFSGDHDAEKRYSPEHYVGWAAVRGYEPEWYGWAVERKLLDPHEGVYRAPFFDADAPDYPELLHIAVRAWDAARLEERGTPKQRVLKYLSENHPKLSTTTREAIAQVANWQRTGGRPPE